MKAAPFRALRLLSPPTSHPAPASPPRASPCVLYASPTPCDASAATDGDAGRKRATTPDSTNRSGVAQQQAAERDNQLQVLSTSHSPYTRRAHAMRRRATRRPSRVNRRRPLCSRARATARSSWRGAAATPLCPVAGRAAARCSSAAARRRTRCRRRCSARAARCCPGRASSRARPRRPSPSRRCGGEGRTGCSQRRARPPDRRSGRGPPATRVLARALPETSHRVEARKA